MTKMIDEINSSAVEETKTEFNAIEENKELVSRSGKEKKIRDKENVSFLVKERKNPLWLAVSEAAKIGGVQNKTIRRAIKSHVIKYKIIGNRYLVDMASLILFLHSTKKLENKLNEFGIGQYIENWKK